MKKKITLIMVLTILITSGIASAQNELPLNPPPGYYGSVTVNGQPAPPGTTIIAKIGGEVRGSITTSVSGLYGDNPGPSKLWVTGYDNELTPAPATVTFYLNDIAAQQTGTLTGAGTINSADLNFIIPAGVVSGGGSSGGGGAGGGGGEVSAEPFDNIALFETRDADLINGIPVTFRFTNPQLAIDEIVITANVNAGLTSAKIEQLKGTSKLVTSPPSGTIYNTMNIWLGSSGFAVPKNIREGIVKFRVNNSWLAGENINADHISMMKWDGSQWISLKTTNVKNDGNFAYYEATTTSFSPFAISGVKAVTTPAVTVAATPGVSPTVTTATVNPPASPNWILYIVVAIIIIAAVYYYTAKKKAK
jgi:PGF-pre-PGF domain-containing protein